MYRMLTETLAVFLLCGTLISASSDKKNVLLIIVDDLRPEIGPYAGRDDAFNNPLMGTDKEDTITPNIDDLAGDSAVFYNAHAQFTTCGPSRASLLTGKRPDTTRVTSKSHNLRDSDKSPDVVTMPQHFKDEGYETYGAGKVFHTGHDDNDKSWTEDNFQPSEVAWYQQGKFDGESWGAATPAMMSKQDLPDQQVLDYATGKLEVLAATPSQPWFMAVGFKKPHLPLICPQTYFDMYPEEDIGLPVKPDLVRDFPEIAWSGWLDLANYEDIDGVYDNDYGNDLPDEKTKELRRAYYACVSWVDSLVGELLDKLSAEGMEDNTVVGFISDHGFHLGEHSEWTKGTLLNLDTHIPWMIKIPGVTDGGSTTKEFVENVDLFPTLVEAAGLDPIAACSDTAENLCHEGQSVLPLVADEDGAHGKKWVMTQYSRKDESDGLDYMGYSIRDENLHYVRWVYSATTGTPDWDTATLKAEELYDYRNLDKWEKIKKFKVKNGKLKPVYYSWKYDPNESRNQADNKDYRDQVEKMYKKLKKGWREAIVSDDK